jgi:hypothetical protein
MKRSFKPGRAGILLVVGVGAAQVGCGGTSEPTPPGVKGDPKQVETSIEDSLSRLAALDIVEAVELASALPAEATACYGVPCPGSEWVQKYQDERARQAPRLAKLVAIAEAVAADESIAPGDPKDAGAALSALTSLQVVDAEALVLVQPANNPDCYNLPCPADQAAAETTNGKHVAEVFAIADRAKKAGL